MSVLHIILIKCSHLLPISNLFIIMIYWDFCHFFFNYIYNLATILWISFLLEILTIYNLNCWLSSAIYLINNCWRSISTIIYIFHSIQKLPKAASAINQIKSCFNLLVYISESINRVLFIVELLFINDLRYVWIAIFEFH